MNLLLGVALVLGLMIMIHEWGHFIVARLFKVRVDVFSIGFGPRLFGLKRGATDYRVSALPFGGYVRMAGQDLSEVDSNDVAPTGAPDELMSKPRWQRALISFAGPAVNLIFPIFLLTGMFVAVGLPYSAFLDLPAQVVALPGDKAGQGSPLQAGDKLVSINAVRNPTWEQVQKALKQAAPGDKLKLEVENAGNRRSVEMTTNNDTTLDRVLGYPPLVPVLDEVGPGTPAERAGLKEGDRIRTVNGKKIEYWGQFVEQVRSSKGQNVKLELDRKGQTIYADVTPQAAVADSGETIYQVGVAVLDRISYRRISFTDGVRDAFVTTGERIQETIGVVGKLFSGRVSVRQLQGAVGISRAAGEAVRRGPLAVISLMVLISVNLGILNLLPIPILDGGNILLLTLEGIRRRDFSLAFKERFVQVGLVFLLVLFAYVMYNDVVRMLPTHS
ncbi:MAG TPA: RIP metalloprotease RseP [Candidatus Acidoferrum sp.]|nr:RIP metalloprotease RseP [Candidatus Acidoferrum sp.]